MMGCAQTSFLGPRKGVWGRGEGEGNWEMIAGRGGGGNHFSLCSGNLKMMGCAQTPFLGPRKGVWGVGEGEGNWEMIARGLSQNPPPNTPETHRTWLRYMATQTHILEPK